MAHNDATLIQILHALKESEGLYVSGAVLATRLGISRAGIWKHIRSLQSMGYEIESHPKEGYRLTAIPDMLLPEEITPNIRTVWLGKNYYYAQEMGSTNDQALMMASKGAPHGTIIIAEKQTQGRGRLNRRWESPERSGIYMSIILTTPLPLRVAPLSMQIAALALVNALRERYDLEASIKWPNDVLIKGKKLAGILAEMQSDQDCVKFLVIGIGINVNQMGSELEGPFRYPATSVASEVGYTLKRQELFLAFLDHFEILYDQFTSHGFQSLHKELESASALLGKTITVHSGNEEICGKALGFTPEGALRLSTKEKKEKIIWVGDVTQIEENR